MAMDRSLDGLDQAERIKVLREEVKKVGGFISVLEGMPADLEEEFLKHVLEYETAEPISLFRLLENAGLEIASPDSLDDQQLTTKLLALIERMSAMGAYLKHTDHLTDRKLYNYLYYEGLREDAVLFPENPSYAYIIDLTGSGSEEDNQTYLKYYADEAHRRQWAEDWPDDPMPERAVAPFDRDSKLPQAPF
jgi:hypothetical protein